MKTTMLLERLLIRAWTVAMGIFAHSATRLQELGHRFHVKVPGVKLAFHSSIPAVLILLAHGEPGAYPRRHKEWYTLYRIPIFCRAPLHISRMPISVQHMSLGWGGNL